MTNDELMLFSGLDQPVEITDDWAYQRIEDIINCSVAKRDAYIALDACKQLVSIGSLSGKTLAKGLYLIKKNWDQYDLDDEFEDIAFIHIGLHKHTVDRYVKVWALFEDGNIPDELKEEIQQRHIKELIPIANAVAQGYEIDVEQWQQLVNAADFYTISKLVRDIKHQVPRKSGITLQLSRAGEIWAYNLDNRYFVGSLEVNNEEPTVQKAIERIKNNSNILEA